MSHWQEGALSTQTKTQAPNKVQFKMSLFFGKCDCSGLEEIQEGITVWSELSSETPQTWAERPTLSRLSFHQVCILTRS